MYTFLIALAMLVLGYIFYGAFLERVFGPDPKRATAVMTKADGIDYVKLPTWRIFMIQFLNIAGLGPIFGAIMGAKFGVASYIWIVFGTIFAGGVHDYLAGMISLRNDGESLPESIGRYLGITAQQVMRIFTAFLLIMVSAVFVAGPAGILANMTAGSNPFFDINFWIVLIFIYYIIATLLPIDKIIGRIYPFFSAALLFMEIGILGSLLFSKMWDLPELPTSFITAIPTDASTHIFPMMFISIACGAISGFHASQSPMMARCMVNEKQGRSIFYGAMIVEGIEALIWAAAATYFFHENGAGEPNAAIVVDTITRSWLGTVGAILATMGVVIAPITSADTALRSARMLVADMLKFEQKSLKSRILVSIPLILASIAILVFSLTDKDGFNVIWRYFAWSNQVLATITLWMLSVYLVKKAKPYIIALLPALLMTGVTSGFVFIAPECLGLPITLAYILTGLFVVVIAILFFVWKRRWRAQNLTID